MQYAFVLGRVYTLSIAELLEVLAKPDPASGLTGEDLEIITASEEVLVINSPTNLRVENLQKKLGGTVKILEVIDQIKKRPQDSVNFALKHYFRPSVLKKRFLKEYKGKIQIGLSLYLLDTSLARRPDKFNPKDKQNSIFTEPKRVGMMAKNTLTNSGQSVRLVLPELNSLSLSSVAVTKNGLLEKGSEICLLVSQDTIFTCKTLVVQDFEDYGRRDYQRPIRDEKQGMIPPKVAQIMLNFSACKPGETILDPFCGIGTIIQEGLLLGFRMVGSDINKFAVKGSAQNLEWFRNRYHIPAGKFGLEVADATSPALLKLIADSGSTIKSIVTECSLGPIYFEYPSKAEISKNFSDLEKLYRGAFAEFAKFLPQGSRIVICIPAYRRNRDSYEFFPSLDWHKDLGYNIKNLIPETALKKMRFLKITPRKTAIYDRKDQIVAREIVVFEKI